MCVSVLLSSFSIYSGTPITTGMRKETEEGLITDTAKLYDLSLCFSFQHIDIIPQTINLIEHMCQYSGYKV